MQIDKDERKIGNQYLIIIYGPPASGKTTLAVQLLSSYQKSQISQGIIISADCFEQYLNENTIEDLDHFCKQVGNLRKLMQYKLRRSLFSEQNWKQSRNYIKQNISDWFNSYSLIIVQDDMLLKSQRKHFRQVAQSLGVKYAEISIKTTLEGSLENLLARQKNQGLQYRISIQTLKECYAKYQIEQNCYQIKVAPHSQIEWWTVKQQAKIVEIEHPEMIQKQKPSAESAEKNQAQISIRNYISEIMRNKQLQKKYFKDRNIKMIASCLSNIKKQYQSKSKTLDGFIQFLNSETHQLL